VERVGAGEPVDAAARAAVAALGAPRVGGRGGVVALDARGRSAAAFNTSRMVRAWIDADGRAGYGIDP
jgi:beta-aspartyl-peptidase (threonine type)